MEQIVQYVQALAVPGIGVLVVALLAQIARQQIARIKDERLRELLLELVKAAEQIYGPGQGAVKLQYVREQAAQHGAKATDRAAIEAAVFDLKAAAPGT